MIPEPGIGAMALVIGGFIWFIWQLVKAPKIDPRQSAETMKRCNMRIHHLAGGRVARKYRR